MPGATSHIHSTRQKVRKDIHPNTADRASMCPRIPRIIFLDWTFALDSARPTTQVCNESARFDHDWQLNLTDNQCRSQARGHWGTCPSNWRLCPISAGAPENYRCRMSIVNWALKVCNGVEIELRSLAICIFRITRSVCSPDLDVYVLAVSTTVTLRCARAAL